jgi:hypothetical protein
LLPLSNRFVFYAPFLILFERGKELERGLRPLSSKLPSFQPSMPVVSYQWFWLERGKGLTANQTQTEPKIRQGDRRASIILAHEISPTIDGGSE